mmetsp:Transcript_13737/g.31797  ORF Transcript_13737/g.31797 Transcript_13737/m.31797 type:complete len:274 (+) Transcript_13737:5638-6459(+)
MPSEDRLVNHRHVLGAGHLHTEGAVVRLQAGVHREGARRGVEARDVLHVLDLLEGELAAVVPAAVVHQLAQQRQGLLRAVDVDLGHVEIVNEVHKLARAEGSVYTAGLLLEGRLHGGLERERVGHAVKIDVEELRRLRVEVAELVLHDCGLTGTSGTDEHAQAALGHELVEQEHQAHGFHRVDEDVPEESVRVVLVRRDLGVPVQELASVGVDDEVEDGAAIREPHDLPLVGPPFREAQAVVHALLDSERATHTPDAAEHEQGLEELRALFWP